MSNFERACYFSSNAFLKIPAIFSFDEIQLILCFYDLLDHNDHTRSKILFNYSLNCVF